ncbi:appr-1-p processing domain protein [Treponema primitia ZAS-2]|uniref:Appr-1-p processing domain protein n=1 Tax=Treponema primitia (strain ATCC BAA-887 / DSM 12427 / ZAS-2) TaxID=545694 RepID=F5YKM2_TREPZ|nr:macro domain-containing protein [Treponema primitia]AEF86163.1 appr-1-p processing domain protein [Treponema primitia ZAS-2]
MNVKILLRDLSKEIVDAWATVFNGYSDVEVSCGNIFDAKADAIVSPANSFGFMDGGIDLVYSHYFGWDLQKKLQKTIQKDYYGELPVGSALVIKTKNKDVKYLISAPTMRLPEDVSKTINAYLAFRAALIEINKFNKDNENTIKKVLCPGLGTLTGLISPMSCATQMKKAYDSVIRRIPLFPRNLAEADTIL